MIILEQVYKKVFRLSLTSSKSCFAAWVETNILTWMGTGALEYFLQTQQNA